MEAVRKKDRFYRHHGVRVRGARYGRAGPGRAEFAAAILAGGLRVIDDAGNHPPCAPRFLMEDARQHGAEARFNVEVREISTNGTVVLSDGTRLAAGLCVNAAGCWSPELTPAAPVKRKGHLVITNRYPGFVHHQLIELGYLKSAYTATNDSVAFNIQPRKTGQMLLGSSRQFNSESLAVEPTLLDRMIRRGICYLPSLGQLSATRVWTGYPRRLRTSCRSSVPLRPAAGSGWQPATRGSALPRLWELGVSWPT